MTAKKRRTRRKQQPVIAAEIRDAIGFDPELDLDQVTDLTRDARIQLGADFAAAEALAVSGHKTLVEWDPDEDTDTRVIYEGRSIRVDGVLPPSRYVVRDDGVLDVSPAVRRKNLAWAVPFWAAVGYGVWWVVNWF